MIDLKKYTIKKWNYYSGFSFHPFLKCRKIEIQFEFTNSCRYFSTDTQLAEQINKLVGFGCLIHHYSSVRIGWRYNQKSRNIDLFRYEYKKGKRIPSILIGSVEIGKKETLILESKKNYYFGVYLKPYFGGEAPAPHTMNIKMGFRPLP